jgi:hypothetical protein
MKEDHMNLAFPISITIAITAFVSYLLITGIIGMATMLFLIAALTIWLFAIYPLGGLMMVFAQLVFFFAGEFFIIPGGWSKVLWAAA